MAKSPRFSAETSPESDDDRSSSLSDLDEGLDAETTSGAARKKMVIADGDSEAETERLEISPNKTTREEQVLVNFAPLDQPLPESSELISAIHQMEGERFSDSAISSPGSSDEDLLSDGGSDRVAEVDDRAFDVSGAHQVSAGQKRKRTVQENESDIDGEQESRSRRKRTGSIRSDAERDPSISDDEASSDAELSRVGSQDPLDVNEDPDDDAMMDANDDDIRPRIIQAGNVMAASKVGKIAPSKARKSLHQETEGAAADQDDEDQVEGPEESDEEDLVEVDEADEADDADDAEDAEAIARSEEEQAKRTAAMEALLDLEKRFATLRDRLYDERIAALNSELAQLSGPNPTHPELLRQVNCVQQYRDEKWDIEQSLLVFKIGALKRRSVAERSQIHSAYFQTTREVREQHLERASEHFYRIQRDRFKTDESIPSYSVPFPTRRSQQITQQTAYNKEVSVLSGVAKYVGFPAAPDIASARAAELNDDMQKMGVSSNSSSRVWKYRSTADACLYKISSNPLRAARPVQQANARSAFSATLSRPAAEEQFLEQTPWANPQHPAHQYLGHANRPASVQSRRPQAPVSTPAGPKMQLGTNGGVGSASTIPEKSSAPASSGLNTPYSTDAIKPAVDIREKEYVSDGPPERAEEAVDLEKRSETDSPSEARKLYLTSNPTNNRLSNDIREASPQTSRMALFSSPTRPSLPRAEYEPRRQTASPLFNQHVRESGLTARPGLGGIGAR